MRFHHCAYKNRRDAGVGLAAALMHCKADHPLVLALPRGGVPVAYEVALALDAQLDVILVRKIGAPGFPELGLGAVVDGQHRQVVLNDELVSRLNPSAAYLADEEQRQVREMERRRAAYCGDRRPAAVRDRVVIVVDDGIATGGTMTAVVKALAQEGVARLIVAVPVAPPSSLAALREEVDDIVCLLSPANFRSVGEFYEDFSQTTDEEVVALLKQAGVVTTRTRDQDRASHRRARRPGMDNV